MTTAKAIFAFGSDNPADLLVNAAAVTCFLGNVAVNLHNEGREPGISQEGCQGLCQILAVVENTINEALNRL
jgi:hypothetical protein